MPECDVESIINRAEVMSQRILTIVVIVLLIIVSLISLNHASGSIFKIVYSTNFIGGLGWITLIVSLLALALPYFKQFVKIWCLFFCIGFFFGPYLEPPSDPLVHLARIQDNHQVNTDEIPTSNKGLWHYSMLSVVICSDIWQPKSGYSHILRIELAHALVAAFLLTVIFLVAKKLGLRSKWAFCSCLIALLFFGTNRFSYFSYYTFAPSATSLMVYWLWIAYFFIKNDGKSTVYGLLVALLLLPILWTNHIQEAIFLIFTICIWLICNLVLVVYRMKKTSRSNVDGFDKDKMALKSKLLTMLVAGVFVILFIIPQFEVVTGGLSAFIADHSIDFPKEFFQYWHQNSGTINNQFGLYLGGKVGGYRVNDTYGGIGLLLVLLGGIYFWPKLIRMQFETKLKIYLLSLLPFILYFTPFFHFLWIANVRPDVYYRLCYSSLFWLAFSCILQSSEGRFFIFLKKMKMKRIST